MRPKMVNYTLETFPPLTEAQRKNLRPLAALPDSENDLSDAPEMTDEAWKKAERDRYRSAFRKSPPL